MKKYIIFAGANGVGKSTLYQTNQQLFDTEVFAKVARFEQGICIEAKNKLPVWTRNLM